VVRKSTTNEFQAVGVNGSKLTRFTCVCCELRTFFNV